MARAGQQQAGGLSNTPPYVTSFAPVAGPRAHLLILGSMPGEASLRAGQYYAHPRNLFWPLMGELAGAHPGLPYEDRLQLLKTAGVALWDVLQSCTRPGSLDSAISNEIPNDLPGFLAGHPYIDCIGFNGRKAETSFRRHFPELYKNRRYRLILLPSTSPAHAARSYEQKRESWQSLFK